MLVINSCKAQEMRSELKHVVQVINEEAKFLFSKLKMKVFKEGYQRGLNEYLRMRGLSTGTL